MRVILPGPIKRTGRDIFASIIMWRNRVRFALSIEPLSRFWGERGKPIHRYYLEQFLQEFSSDIRGHCLEFQEDSYASRFGEEKISKIDIIHLTDDNPNATIVCDLTKPNHIPDNLFDCIICTYVLHLVFDFNKLISELFRILKPDGSLIVAVPLIMISYPQFHEFWRFTEKGLSLSLEKAFGENRVMTRSYGNSLTAAGEVRGLVTKEFTRSELDHQDSHFGMVICARALKTGKGLLR